MGRIIALVAALAGALLLAWTGTRTTAPEPAGPAPAATAFRTDLAMADIRRIARTPHPIGSPANAQVRDYLIGRMGALGLQPSVQAGLATQTRAFGGETWLIGGEVENIVGVLPGKDGSAPALALMAHYDSVPASPGAADDATGTAVALDVIRALKARGTPERDVIVILTDGEEAGLLGARLFFREHPLRQRIGLLINLESRGGGGRANMFQTGAGNGALVPIFARTAVAPASNSLAVFLYSQMPNDTDFTVSKDAGVRGLNFAFIGRQFDYHSPTSTPANLDLGSVRSMGDQALAAAADLAFAQALPGKAPDAVYSQTFGDHVLAYPAWGGWIALLIAGGLIALAWTRARRSEDFRPWDMARGAGAGLFLLLAGALLLHLARRATGVGFGFMEQRALLAQWSLWETCLAALAAGLLVLVPALQTRPGSRWSVVGASLFAGLLCLAFAGWDPVGAGLAVAAGLVGWATFGRAAKLSGAWLGLLLTGLLVGAALQIALPAVAFLVAWPLVLASLAAALSAVGARMDRSRTAALTLLAALGGGWLAVFFHGVAQGLDLPDILTLFPWLAALLIWPLAWPGAMPRLALTPAVALLALGVVLVGVVRFSDPWTARNPQATTVFHVTDAVTGKTRLVSSEKTLSPWTRAALTAEGGKIEKVDLPPLLRRLGWAAASKAGAAGTPPVTASVRPDGRVELHLPAAGAVFITLTGKTGFLGDVMVGGVPVRLPSSEEGFNSPPRTTKFSLRLAALRDAQTVVLQTGDKGDIEINYAVFEAGWRTTAKPLPPRPTDAMPFDLSDSSVITGTVHLSHGGPLDSLVGR